MSNYPTKADIKNILHIDTSSFALKSNLATLKTEVDKLDIDKLAPVPVDLSKLSNVVKNEVVKKTEYNAKTKNIEDKIPDITKLATKTILNAKINEIKTEIPSISYLATTSALTAVENEIPNVSNLIKKTDYDTKVNELKRKLLIIVMINILLLQNLIS